MSATDTSPDHAAEEQHTTPRDYVRVALVLAVLTALEISTYFVEFGPIGIPLLVVLMIIKFVLVAGIFMHLKFDNRVYTQLFYGGLTLAVFLYILAATIMLFASAPTL